MSQGLAVVFVAWVKEQVQWRPCAICNGRHLGCYDVFGDSSTETKVEAQDVHKGAFEDVLLGPVGEIVIDGLP